jgi:hypothetical protein
MQLHPLKTLRPVLGEDQIVDVDLDRSVAELPLRVHASSTLDPQKSNSIHQDITQCKPLGDSDVVKSEKGVNWHSFQLV